MENRSTSPWFGNVSDDFKIYISSGKENQTAARRISISINVTVPFIPLKIAQVFLGEAPFIEMAEDSEYSSSTYYGTIEKGYGETEFGREFSNYETMFIFNIYIDKTHSNRIYNETEIYESQKMMDTENL